MKIKFFFSNIINSIYKFLKKGIDQYIIEKNLIITISKDDDLHYVNDICFLLNDSHKYNIEIFSDIVLNRVPKNDLLYLVSLTVLSVNSEGKEIQNQIIRRSDDNNIKRDFLNLYHRTLERYDFMYNKSVKGEIRYLSSYRR